MRIHNINGEKMADEADFKDAMYAFRKKISEEITHIYQAIAKLEQEIKKIKETP
jgi:hypothetical protein